MFRSISNSHKSIARLISAALLAGSVTVSTQAHADPGFGPHPMFWNHPGHHFGGYGYGLGPAYGYGYGPEYGYGSGYGYAAGGAALAGGLMLGALAASAAAAQNCHMEKKPMVDPYGNKYFTQVRVCE